MSRNTQPKVGLWLVGACGRVGSTVAMGLAAIHAKRAPRTGLVSERPEFRAAGLIDAASIVLGGHELRAETLPQAVEDAHAKAGLFDRDLLAECKPALRTMQRNIRQGTAFGITPDTREAIGAFDGVRASTTAAEIERLRDDLSAFRRRHRLDHVVVVNVASSEPPAEGRLQRISLQKLKRMLGKKVAPASSGAKRSTRTPGRGETGTIPASCLYALAAIETGCPFVNFTPSTGIALPAIRQRADELGVPYMGNDGKTGETLVKSALAPLFATRNLSVLSWVGQNILGNRDGAVLKNPRTQASKLRTKDGVVSRIVGGAPMTQVSIDYVPSLDDWKVAWDFIHFEGFLGTKMSMQFTWQGCDSILAAPLIIDLVRFTVLETQRGASGPMRHLAFFFKDPIDVDVHDLAGQWRMLVSHVTHESVPSRAMTRIR